MSQFIKRAEIARHWGVSPAYVTMTLKRHGGGDLQFSTLEEADRWRSIHAPPKPSSESRRAFSGEQTPSASPDTQEKNREASSTTPRVAHAQGHAHAPHATTPPPAPAYLPHAPLDVQSFVSAGGDFDSVMLRQAEEVPQIAYGLYRLACGRGDSVEIANATRNWNDAAKASAGVREKYLELQEKTRALIPLDLVMDVVGTELQPIRVLMLKGGERYGARANPSDPALGKTIIDELIDHVFRALDLATTRTERELLQGPVAT